MIDIHNHSRFSFDSTVHEKEMLERAKVLGASVYGFAEHMNIDPKTDIEQMKTHLKAYVEAQETLRKNERDVLVLHGLEVNYYKECEKQIKQLCELYPFDYIINGVHSISALDDMGLWSTGASEIPIETIYYYYFDEVERSLDVAYDFQIVGHMGVLEKLRTELSSEQIYDLFGKQIDRILSKIIAKELCLEVNTSISANKICVPNERILKRYFELGGRKVSLGADAHTEARVLDKIPLAMRMLQGLGFEYITYYKNKQEKRVEIAKLLRGE